ncbi:MAG TPA: helix-turn-helix domain-containing protein [Alphaproteobacteria bacterium]|nr:helix-turn-helix domain-containing protein [Alphaproteobacteria bacterium]
MQEARQPRSNRERTQATRHALISSARTLFVEKGYAATSTPEIAAAAGITRGALYHHFEDKRDLLRAVLDREARAVAEEIEAATPSSLPPREALLAGSIAYLDAMTVPGRTRLLLVDGPAMLGSTEIEALDKAHAARMLREGLEAALAGTGDVPVSIAALAVLLSAAFDRAALAIESGADPTRLKSAMTHMVERLLCAPDRQAGPLSEEGA